MRFVNSIQQFARPETGSVNIALDFSPNLGGGFPDLLREDRASPRLQLLSRRLEFCDARAKLIANIPDRFLQRELVQPDHRERRIVVIQPNAMTRSHFSHQPSFVERRHRKLFHANGSRSSCANKSFWTM